MVLFETIKCMILAVLILLQGLIAIVIHRIGTIRKWEIEKERETRKQPEYQDQNMI